MAQDERRKNTRVEFHTSVDVSFPDASYQACPTENLSTKGVFVDNIPGRALGDSCDIILRLEGSEPPLQLTMSGEVVRLEKNGVGIHFQETDLDSFSHLRQIVYYNSEDPDTIDDNFLEA